MVDREFVQRKLELITEELGHLVQFRGASFDEITGDFVKLAAVERILERIVNRAVDLNEHLIARTADGREEKVTRLTYKETFLRLADLEVYSRDFAEEISKSAGLRNILVHEYNDVDHQILHGSIRTCIEQYRHYVRYVGSFLQTLDA